MTYTAVAVGALVGPLAVGFAAEYWHGYGVVLVLLAGVSALALWPLGRVESAAS